MTTDAVLWPTPGRASSASKHCGTSPSCLLIMMCDSSDEVLMLACVLLQRVKHMMDTQIGKDGRKQIFKDANLK